MTATGKATKKKSDYKLLKLKKGTITVNAGTTREAIGLDKCHADSEHNKLLGVGLDHRPGHDPEGDRRLRQGISGTVTFAAEYAAVVPRTSSGKCTEKTAAPSRWRPTSSFIGTGTVSFS